MVSIDEAKLSQAFGVTIDQNEIADKTKEYINQISNEITADVSPVKNALIDRFKTLTDGLKTKIAGVGGTGGSGGGGGKSGKGGSNGSNATDSESGKYNGGIGQAVSAWIKENKYEMM